MTHFINNKDHLKTYYNKNKNCFKLCSHCAIRQSDILGLLNVVFFYDKYL